MANSKKLVNLCLLKYHYVYQTKNLINGKTYIGRHSTNDVRDGYMGSGKMLQRAFKKYGKNNFVITILSFFDTYEEAVEEEKFLVTREYCELIDNYNIVEGGSNPVMYGENNPSWKGGISKDPMYRKTGIPHNFSGENNPRHGYKYSEEEKLKMRDTQKCTSFYADGVFYKSIRNYVAEHGRSKCYIKRRLNSPDFPEWYTT